MLRLSPSGPFLPLQTVLDGYDAGVVTGFHKFAPVAGAQLQAGDNIIASCPITVHADDLPDKKRVMLVARVEFEYLTPGASSTNLVYYLSKRANPAAIVLVCDSHSYQPLVRTVEESEGLVSLVTYKFYHTFVAFGGLSAGDGWVVGSDGEFLFSVLPAGVDSLIVTGGECWFIEFTGKIPIDLVGPIL